MIAHHQPKAPETERAFKEVLYRFMGDVYATKAAMYLKTPGEGWALATQYGFGRRDRLSEIFADDHPLVRMVRAFGEDARFYNDPSEIGEVASYLADAGTARLMLVPLIGREGQIGFVDVRDKGGQRPFVRDDLDLARSIAAGLTQLVEEVDVVEPARETKIAEAPVESTPVVELPPDSSDEPEALLDEPGFDEINTAAADGLTDPRVVAIALTIASHSSGATLVHQRTGASIIDLDPLVKHQVGAMYRRGRRGRPKYAGCLDWRQPPAIP